MNPESEFSDPARGDRPGKSSLFSMSAISSGVVIASKVPDLAAHIRAKGRSLQRTNLEADLREAITEIIAANTKTFEEINSIGLQVDVVLDQFVLAFENEDFELTENGIKYSLGSLGGLNFVWVTESPYITFASRWTIGDDNTGDLSIAHFGSTNACFSLPPEAYPPELLKRMTIFKISNVFMDEVCYTVAYPPKDLP